MPSITVRESLSKVIGAVTLALALAAAPFYSRSIVHAQETVHTSPNQEQNPDHRLKEVESALKKGQVERERISQKADALNNELTHIKIEMINAARAVQEHEEKLSELELQMHDLAVSADEKNRALDLKRQQMNGVLTALQRLAFRPSEALIAQPTSPSDTVRSAILLRNVLPRIQQSAKELQSDLASLASLRNEITQQKSKIAATTEKLDDEHRRLAALVERKEALQAETAAQWRETDKRVSQLAGEAGDLRDLIVRLEDERKRREAEEAQRIAAEAAAREADRRAAQAAVQAAHEAELAAAKAAHEAELAAQRSAKEKQEKEKQEAEVATAHEAEEKARETVKAAAVQEEQATREAQKVQDAKAQYDQQIALTSFSKAQGGMPFPARGDIVVKFGEDNTLGVPSKGLTIETRPDAQVIAPYEGRVVFAGPFRGYGLLLIIEHSEGYHTLLAGMSRIDSNVGQHILVGEPVGTMGQSESKPFLYVELRHNGQPINPLPWLTARKTKVTG